MGPVGGVLLNEGGQVQDFEGSIIEGARFCPDSF
jgi:hypothetical protein